MDIEIKVVPFIQTMGNDDFKSFIRKDFTPNILFNTSNDIILFNDWRGKSMGTWYKYTNGDGVILEFYPEHYIIQPPKLPKIKLPLPNTVDDFINDIYKYNIRLLWSDWVIENFEPKQFIHNDEIRDYYRELLGKIDKGFELI